MVTFKMIKKYGEVYTYEYFPEDKFEARGEICFDHANKKLIYHHKSKTHSDNYFVMMTKGLKDSQGDFKKTGMVAWY